jgi:Raf kinase inhibitor-like YbhB/YbcL family protein
MFPRRRTLVLLVSALLLTLFVAFRIGSRNLPTALAAQSQPPAAAFTLSSPAFKDSAEIPRASTCDGGDQSPELAWTGAPARAQSFAVIVADADAPSASSAHWLLWNLPAQPANLPAGVPTTPALDSGARQGPNDFHRIGYAGPCPPPGKPHRYFFTLYALDAKIMPRLKPDSAESSLEDALQPHILAQAQLMGTYHR